MQIENLSHDGRGVARIHGKVTFIEGVLPNEKITYRVTKTGRKFDEAQCVDLIDESPHRTAPKCDYYHECGGCQLQHLKYSAQIEHKQTHFEQLIQKNLNCKKTTFVDPLTADEQNYRRRARLGVFYNERHNKLSFGFRKQGTNRLLDIDDCPVLDSNISNALPVWRAFLENWKGVSKVGHIEVTQGDLGQCWVVNITKPLTEPQKQALATFALMQQVNVYLKGKETQIIHESFTNEYTVQQAHLQFESDGFMQVNAKLNEKMVTQALNWLDIQPEERILDLFCGLGNFSLPIATVAKELVGIDGDKALIETAKMNAQNNSLENMKFHIANLFEDVSYMPWVRRQQYDKVLLDPGREGASEICQNMNQFKAKRIVYVSCNPSTMVRDGQELEKQGFKLKRAGIMDMFPQTKHVEAMMLWEK